MFPDPTDIDPEGHRIVFENDHVRIVEARHVAGTEFPEHTHRPRVVVSVGTYRMRSVAPDGSVTIVDRRAGDAVWIEEEHHAATVLVGPTHAIEIEVKSAERDS